MKTKVLVLAMLFISIMVSGKSLSPEDINVFIQRYENKQLTKEEISKNVVDIDQTAQEVLIDQKNHWGSKNEQKNLLLAAKIANIPSLTEVVSLSRYNNGSPDVCELAKEMFFDLIKNENESKAIIDAEMYAVSDYPWPVAVNLSEIFYSIKTDILQNLFDAAEKKTSADSNYFAPELFRLATATAIQMKNDGTNYKEIVTIIKKQTKNPNKKVRKKAKKALSTIQRKTI